MDTDPAPRSVRSSPGHARLTALGHQLVDIHVWLRGELDQLRGDVDAYVAGDGELPKLLPAHCAAFCTALQRHHTGEDGGAFPVLAAEFPELAPVIGELKRDHQLVSGALAQLDRLLRETETRDARQLKQELDTLAALLETHFTYEERRLANALNSLSGHVAEELFGQGQPEWST